MRGHRNHRAPWRPYAHPIVSAEDAKEEDDARAEVERHYCGALCSTSLLPATAPRKSSPITALSPTSSCMPAATSAASDSASATSSADGASGLASRGPFQSSPAFFEGKDEEATHLTQYRGRLVRRAPQSCTPASSHGSAHSPHLTSAHGDTQQPPPNERESDGATAPLSAWSAAPVLNSAPTELCSDDVALGAPHRSDDQGLCHTAAIADSAVLEHYHVLELEEQLQYWRQRALHVEGRALQRERALQARWEAEFVAAQASSETIIRKLLDKQNRLQTHLNLRKSTAQHTAVWEHEWRSSRASMNSISSAPNSSVSDSGGHHTQGQQQQRLRRGHRRNSQQLQEKDIQPQTPTDICHYGGNEAEGAHGTLSGSEENDVTRMRSFVAHLKAENASLRESLAELQRELQQLGRSRKAANAAEGGATHHEELHVTLQAHLHDLCRAALGCLLRCRELRRKSSGDTHTTNAGDTEEEHAKCMVKGLQDVLSEWQAKGESSPSLLAQPLLALHSALEHLDAVLRSCVNDIVLVDGRLASASLAANVPQQQQPRDDHRNADLKEQLREARAALFREQQRRATAQSALDAAVRDMRNLAQAHQVSVSQLRIEARVSVEQAREEYHAKVARTRAALEHNVVAAARRASAAEHQSSLHTQREAQWQTQLSALRNERDVYAQECALLKSRLELLQPARNATAAERARQPQGRVDKAVLTSQSHVSARHSVKPLSRPVSPVVPRAAVGAKTTTVASASEVPPVDASSPAPRVTWTGVNLNRRTANGYSSGGAGASPAPLSPRRSLSYSPLRSVDKGPKVAPGAAVHDTARARGARLTNGVHTAGSGAPRLPSAFPSPPINVVQPSLLAAPQDSGYAEVNTAAQQPRSFEGGEGVWKDGVPLDSEAFEQAHFTPWKASSLQLRSVTSPSTPSRQYAPMAFDAAVVGTPLARMRAWEEKFEAILRHS
ncbi:hypothetical protein GH5_06356 [Leishmania sp. Ghana 2012 LV757]|uniref:hypothetical protein n=1 Tax=Leishmania sp. Ghana 2012 LV757 TaxID=2803181 RepID=UPI001B47844B|nr:hypothetical protein GH5_06356 [Leishmania sp. Ghana 2012 LV757]